MAEESSNSVLHVTVPQVDLNDVKMDLIEWKMAHGDKVEKGSIICTLETAKATHDLTAEAKGILFQIVEAGTRVKVGDTIAYMCDNLETIKAFITQSQGKKHSTEQVSEFRVTPKAKQLAEEYQIDLRDVPRKGAIVKEKDVQQYLNQLQQDKSQTKAADQKRNEIPAMLHDRVKIVGELSRHQAAIATHLKTTQENVILATSEVEVCLEATYRFLENDKENSANLFHLVLLLTAKLLDDFPLLMTFQHNGKLYRYRDTDIAFTVADAEHDHRLLTPVVSRANGLTLNEIETISMELTLLAYRGEIQQNDLIGGCFTISMLTGLEVSRFTALQNQFQSAILAVGCLYEKVVKDEKGDFTEKPFVNMTLSYDHTICNGYYSGDFLTRLKQEIEGISKE